MNFRLRLLPLVIFAASLTLSLKIGTLWEDAALSWSAEAIAESSKAVAEMAGAAKSEKPKSGAVSKKSRTSKKKSTMNDSAGEPAGSAATDSSVFDAASATDTEIELLQKLADRRRELEEREQRIGLREAMLSATERRIDAKIAELAKIRSTIEGLLEKHDAQQEAKLKSLVKIYENMKPKDAARIFDRLDLGILLDVVERMRESKTAPIMANMSPARAKTVTAALAERRTLPTPRRQNP